MRIKSKDREEVKRKKKQHTSRQGTTKMVIRFLTCDGPSIPPSNSERGFLFYFSAIYYPGKKKESLFSAW